MARQREPLDNNDPENFSSHGFAAPHGPPPPRGSYRPEHPLPSAQRGQHARITHGDDFRAFGHPGSSTSRHIERDEQVPQKLPGALVERDAQGHPAFSEGLGSAGSAGADRIRARAQPGRNPPTDPFDPSISSELSQYNRD